MEIEVGEERREGELTYPSSPFSSCSSTASTVALALNLRTLSENESRLPVEGRERGGR